MQKFKRGNLVKVLVGHKIWSTGGVMDLSPENVGRRAIVEYSYAEKFGGSNVDSYSILWEDTGSSQAWKDTKELELIDEGGEHLITEALAKRDLIHKDNTDLKKIKDTWVEKEGRLSSDTILFLFEKIGYPSKFISTGEFYILSEEWANLYPFFNLFMTSPNADFLKDVPKKHKQKIMSFFEEIQSLNST